MTKSTDQVPDDRTVDEPAALAVDRLPSEREPRGRELRRLGSAIGDFQRSERNPAKM